MNIFVVISFLLAGGVFFVSVFTATDNPQMLVDPHGALIVIGGSLAATAISFQLDRLWMMLKVFWYRTIRGRKPDYVAIIRSLMKIAESYRNESGDLQKQVDEAGDFFISEAMEVLQDGVLDRESMIRILTNRVDTIYKRYSEDANRFKSVGKYPPAMGLMGATLGMIALLGTLGTPGAEKGVGPAMSVALVATFYGIALSNLFVLPIGENLAECAKEIKTKNKIIVEGINLIALKTNPIVLAEELNSYLLPGDRIDWKNV